MHLADVAAPKSRPCSRQVRRECRNGTSGSGAGVAAIRKQYEDATLSQTAHPCLRAELAIGRAERVVCAGQLVTQPSTGAEAAEAETRLRHFATTLSAGIRIGTPVKLQGQQAKRLP